MRKLDQFAFWVIRAITEPNNSDRKHFYDQELNLLFSIQSKGNLLTPLYRNDFTKNKGEFSKKFEVVINKIKNKDVSVIQLPRLTYDEKRNYLQAYIANVVDLNLKHKLKMDVNNFTENDEFKFKTDLKAFDKNLYLKEDLDRGVFISGKIREMYEPLGISEESEIIW